MKKARVKGSFAGTNLTISKNKQTPGFHMDMDRSGWRFRVLPVSLDMDLISDTKINGGFALRYRIRRRTVVEIHP
jgi:hypothetical protein